MTTIEALHETSTLFKPRKGWRYPSVEHFVLAKGRQFAVTTAEPLRQGGMKCCLKNASSLAKRKNLIYCEGYARYNNCPRPLFHAWCIDDKDVVYDPTWPDGCDYFGVPISLDYVLGIRKQVKNAWLSAIDSPGDFPRIRIQSCGSFNIAIDFP